MSHLETNVACSSIALLVCFTVYVGVQHHLWAMVLDQ